MPDAVQRYLPVAFALLVGAAGWFYLFYSRAAHRLAGVEDPRLNRRRVVLRRVCGVMMLLLAVSFFVLLQPYVQRTPQTFSAALLVVLGLLLAIVVLAMLDVRLTWQLRRALGQKKRMKEEG